MDELINQITSRTGLPEEQARQVAEVVLGFVKSKLPEPIASQVDSFLGTGGGEEQSGMMGQIQEQLGNLGGLLGQ
ncbi:MAG: hypothetical protein VKJ24_12430 [Synechococcales bacterium]|nr:hypothetical protein [Synechococcales bacterium]